MANIVNMPKQGLQMREGTIMKWLVKEGQKAVEGEPLFEMETDKLTIVIDSTYSGTILKILKNEGEVVPITEAIAIIGETGEDISGMVEAGDKAEEDTEIAESETIVEEKKEAVKPEREKRESDRVFISPRAKKLALENDVDINLVEGTGPQGRIVERDIQVIMQSRPKITATARKYAEDKDVDLGSLDGGKERRIYKKDVDGLIAGESPAVSRGETVIPFTSMRRIIADRMCQSKREMAQTNHKIKVDASELVRAREAYKGQGIKVSYNDFIVKLVSKVLREFPMMNSSLTDDGIVLKEYVNMGMAVAVENGLIVPVIEDSDLMDVQQISERSSELIEKTKTGRLEEADYTGGTFTISNLGMYDIDEFVAIINPPEAGILAVGKMEYVPVVVDKTEIEIKPIIKLTLSYDHRTVDGADAAKFLSRVKQLVENPYLAL